jgi:hypothetical protein
MVYPCEGTTPQWRPEPRDEVEIGERPPGRRVRRFFRDHRGGFEDAAYSLGNRFFVEVQFTRNDEMHLFGMCKHRFGIWKHGEETRGIAEHAEMWTRSSAVQCTEVWCIVAISFIFSRNMDYVMS